MIKNVNYLGKYIRKRLRQDFDVVIGITGGEGIGKSTLAIQLGMAIDKDFDLEKNIIYIPDYQVIAKRITKELSKYSVLIVDEAVKTMYKRRWQSKAQIFLNQLYSICRKQNIASILAMPNFNSFDKYWREHRILLWIHIIKRGYAVVFVKDWSPFTFDPWHVKFNQELVDKKMRRRKVVEATLNKKLSILRLSKNYLATIKFKPLKQRIFKRYTELNAGFRLEMAAEYEPSSTVRYRRGLINVCAYLYKDMKLSQKEIAKMVGVSRTTINLWLEKKKARKIDKETS